MSATLVVVTSDQHAGSSVALCPPKIELDDGGEYVASKAQQWLWQNWLDFWQRVERVREREKAKLYQVWNGDLTEGNHHGSTQILSDTQMSKKEKPPVFTPPDKVSVSVCRNGAEISAVVEWGHAPAVLKALLDVFRESTKDYPKLLQELQHLGGTSTSYDDSWWYADKAGKRPPGFR